MSSNIFKRRNQTFVSEPVKKTYVSLKSDFPSLVSEKERKGMNNALNFTQAIQKEIICKEEVKEFVLPSGYVMYSFEPDRSISVRYSREMDPMNRKIETVLGSREDMISAIMNNWKRFKEDFIERNGEDEYDRLYSCPCVFDDLQEEDNMEEDSDLFE